LPTTGTWLQDRQGIHLRFTGHLSSAGVAGMAGVAGVAGVAFGYIHLRFAWQTWHLLHLVARLGRDWSDAAVLCVAGMALGNMHLRFARQAWHLATCTFVLRGRRGMW